MEAQACFEDAPEWRVTMMRPSGWLSQCLILTLHSVIRSDDADSRLGEWRGTVLGPETLLRVSHIYHKS